MFYTLKNMSKKMIRLMLIGWLRLVYFVRIYWLAHQFRVARDFQTHKNYFNFNVGHFQRDLNAFF